MRRPSPRNPPRSAQRAATRPVAGRRLFALGGVELCCYNIAMKKLVLFALCTPLTLLAGCGSDPPATKCVAAGCDPTPASCHNGTIDAGEDCDGADLNAQSCASLAGFSSGSLTCYPNCKFNTAACVKGMAVAGIYDMRMTLDLSEKLPQLVLDLNAMLKDPAAALADGLTTAIIAQGSPYSSIPAPTLKAALTLILTPYFTGYATTMPPAVQKMVAALDASVDFARNVTVLSTFTITVKNSSPTTAGSSATSSALNLREEWTDLALLWNYGCVGTGVECEQRFPIFSFSNADGTSNAVSYGGEAMQLTDLKPKLKLASNDSPRTFTFSFKDVVDTYYSKVLIPKITQDASGLNAKSDLGGLLTWLIDCPAVATAIANSDGITTDAYYTITLPVFGLLSVSKALLESTCTAACSAIGAKWATDLDAAIDLGQVQVSGYGDAVFADTDLDKKADTLSDGMFNGFVQLLPKSGAAAQTFLNANATFSAKRR